jgi:uncharacterized ion transporter superfamily protein YfcC
MREDGARYNRGNHSKLVWGLFLAGFIVLGVASVVVQDWWFVVANAFLIIGMVVSWRRAAMDKPR